MTKYSIDYKNTEQTYRQCPFNGHYFDTRDDDAVCWPIRGAGTANELAMLTATRSSTIKCVDWSLLVVNLRVVQNRMYERE